jgi:hypothetical protein
MHLTPVNSNVNFSGNYSGHIQALSKDSQTLAKQGVEAINRAKKYLQKIQNINCGAFTLSNSERVSKISPVLQTGLGDKEIRLTPFNDGFNLAVKDKFSSSIDILNVWGGDFVEFESSNFPLKSKDYKPLSGEALDSVEKMIKKYIPLFCPKKSKKLA